MRLTIDEQLTETIIQQIKKDLRHREDLVIRPVKIDEANVYFCYLTETVNIDALAIETLKQRFMIEKKRKNPDALFFACQEMGPAEQEQTPRDYLNVILNHQLLVVCEVAVSVSIGTYSA